MKTNYLYLLLGILLALVLTACGGNGNETSENNVSLESIHFPATELQVPDGYKNVGNSVNVSMYYPDEVTQYWERIYVSRTGIGIHEYKDGTKSAFGPGWHEIPSAQGAYSIFLDNNGNLWVPNICTECHTVEGEK